MEAQWGTVIGIDVADAISDELVDAVFAWFARVDDLFSTWRDDSAISRLARREIELADAPAEVREVLDRCDELTIESRGAFDVRFAADPRVAPRQGFGPIDPSGFVKGWALEQAATLLAGAGIVNFSINAGGDVLTRGRPEAGRLWHIGVQHPFDRAAVAAVVVGSDLAVATSGRYERGDHVIDPRTGRPAHGLAAVTVVGDDLGRADAYATAALVLGDDGIDWLAAQPGIEAMTIDEDHTATFTPGFPREERAA